MKKMEYKRTSINIEKNLYLLAVDEGIEFTAFFNRCLALFFDVPEDPRLNLVKEKSEYSILRLKEKYQKEIIGIIKEHESQSSIRDQNAAKEAELVQFGDYLQRTTLYPAFRLCLERRDPDDKTLSKVTSEINRMNGNHYQEMELWNRAITWYQKYGVVALNEAREVAAMGIPAPTAAEGMR